MNKNDRVADTGGYPSGSTMEPFEGLALSLLQEGRSRADEFDEDIDAILGFNTRIVIIGIDP